MSKRKRCRQERRKREAATAVERHYRAELERAYVPANVVAQAAVAMRLILRAPRSARRR
jgi:hypothetical protein